MPETTAVHELRGVSQWVEVSPQAQRSGQSFGPQIILNEQTDAKRELPQSTSSGSFHASIAKTTRHCLRGEHPSNQWAGASNSASCSVYLDITWIPLKLWDRVLSKQAGKWLGWLFLGLRMPVDRGMWKTITPCSLARQMMREKPGLGGAVMPRGMLPLRWEGHLEGEDPQVETWPCSKVDYKWPGWKRELQTLSPSGFGSFHCNIALPIEANKNEMPQVSSMGGTKTKTMIKAGE